MTNDEIPNDEGMTNDEIPNDEGMTNDEIPNDEGMTNDSSSQFSCSRSRETLDVDPAGLVPITIESR